MFKLTPLQEGMLYESVVSAKPWANLEQIVIHLEDELVDAGAMRAAWQGTVDATPVLRSVIDWQSSDEPVQRFHPPAPFTLDVTDWRAEPDPDAALQIWLAKDRSAGVDPSTYPGFRVSLFVLGPMRGVLVWTFLHTLLDGRSMVRVLDDVFWRYEAGLGKKPQPEGGVPTSIFEAHCLALQGQSHAEGAAFFANRLNGYDAAYGIADDTQEASRKIIADLELDEAETLALTGLAEEGGVSVGTIVQAAWGIVLGRWSDRGDAVFGATLSGRHLVPGARNAIGCFINTVPMRLRLGRGLELGEVLTRLRADQIGLRPYEQTPLSEIKALSEVPPDRPLFDSMVMFERGSMQQLLWRLGGNWPRRRVEFLEEGALPATLAVYHDQRLKLRLEYDPAQVPEGDRVSAYVLRLLRSMIAGGISTPLAQLDMLDRAEAEKLWEMARPTPEIGAGDTCCLTTFENRVRLAPDRIAVSQPGAQSLTYAELDERATRLASRLTENGVEQSSNVAVCMSRTPDFVVAQIATWKAGAAFIPMDPEYPPKVLSGMCEDGRAVLAIVDEAAPELPCPTVTVSASSDGILPALPDTDRASSRTAYVIFTSGSTGRPKGVAVSHGSLAAHHAAMTERYGLVAQDKVLQFASLSFDVSLEEIIPTLLNGSELVMRTPEMAGSFKSFLEQVSELRLSVLNLPTAFWTALTEELVATGSRLPACVRLVVVGGERVPAPALRRWREIEPNRRWINGYGPTETTITCTTYEAGEILPQGDSVPIGKPTPHARAMVVARDGSLAPDGAVGELCIAGPAVATGYVGLPDQTAERFGAAPDRLGGGRMYHSGDMARWQSDRNLAYLGRGDRQIKLRGFRIEPAEIEKKLEGLDQIDHAVVSVDQPDSDQARLVAWVSLVDGGTKGLQEAVARTFQSHMRPLVVPVEEWPQTPGGKIDVKRLPAPPRADAAPDLSKPANDTTRGIAAIFAKVLGTRQVDPDSSFFDLGGHSLLVLRLIGQIERQYGFRLAAQTVVSNPTPRGLTRALREQPEYTDPHVVWPIQPNGSRPPIFGVHVIGAEGSFFRPLAEVMGQDQPVFGLTVGMLSEETPVGIEETAQFYFEQIQKRFPDGPLSLAAVSLGSYVALDLAQRLIAAGREVRVLALFDAEGPAGRKSLRGLRKLVIHARLTQSEGLGYVGGIVSAKFGDLRHKAEMIQRTLTTRRQGVSSPALTIGQFVAANDLARQAYQPKPYPRPITLFRAAGNHFDCPEGIAEGLGWKGVAAGGFEVIDIPGDHLSILEPPNVDQLGRALMKILRQAEQEQDI
ncbi:non-ribosomal peptide synthetase [Primorskyibacter sp. S87]|uniref:non-ribosomal peptide synthetase n=1 Tax=Primorskyibacter sp. S87 TaxID=3415126 RepID=UPI003C7B1E6D